MDFKKLPEATKIAFHDEIMACANALGGKNPFLKLIEEIRAISPSPLLNTTGTFHTTEAKVTLSKSMFKDKHTLLFDAMRREEKSGDMLNGVNPKEYKAVMGMMRTLGNVIITVESKKLEENNSFEFKILDTTEEKKTKVTWLFKVIFFYHLEEAKKALNYSKAS